MTSFQSAQDQKYLILMRHAKAEAATQGSDYDRALTERGHNQAREAGAWLVQQEIIPEAIVCSTALRTRQTCTWVCEELGEQAPTPRLEDALYDGGHRGMLGTIALVPDAVRVLLVISHMPTVQEVSIELASRDSDPEAYQDVATGFRTGSMACFSLDNDWAVLEPQALRLSHFFTPA